MNPIVIALGAGGLAVGLYKTFFQKPQFQVSQTRTSDGVPIKIAVPVPESVNYQQATGKMTRHPSARPPVRPSAKPGSATAVTTPNQGVVYSPPQTIQPGSNGKPQPTPVIISPTGSTSMSIGSVKDVQRALNTLGILPLLKEDGVSGPKTIANIKQFQSKSGLVVDGNAGAATKAALSAAIANLASGGSSLASTVKTVAAPPVPGAANSAPPVNAANTAAALSMTNKQVQENLNILGAKPPLATDGKLGPLSVAAIKAFQTTHGLVADGIAGPKTKTAIYVAVHSKS